MWVEFVFGIVLWFDLRGFFLGGGEGGGVLRLSLSSKTNILNFQFGQEW